MANNSVVNALINSYMPQPGDEDLMPPTAGYQNPERDVNSILSIAGARLSDRLSDAGVSIAKALMAPGNAAMGQYDQRPVYADGSVGMFDPRMEEDVANLAGLVSLGAAPIPRPSGSISMGLRSKPGSALPEQYGMSHRPNTIQDGMTLDNPLYAYGNDIYGANASQFYGTLDKVADRESLSAIARARSNPQAMVKVYRAVPSDVSDASINPGDWVTTSRKYASDHGEGWLGGNYTVLEIEVPAGQLATSGDSIHEWGWWP